MSRHAPPCLIDFEAIGSSQEGYLSVGKDLPFEVKRVFWTYFTPQSVTRGRHAHHKTHMVIVAVHGKISISTETLSDEKNVFVLDLPTRGLYLPPLCWHVLEYSHDAVQVVLTSTEYDPSDYIRDYTTFRQMSHAPR